MSNVHSIAVCFDEATWNYWGISWTASLNYLAKFSGQVVVVDFGVSSKTHDFFDRLKNYVVIPAEKKYGLQELDFIHTVNNYAKNGVWAAWDKTCYFQSDINEIFDLASEKLVFCRSSSPQLDVKSSVNSFGYKNTLAKDQEKFCKVLKKISRIYNKPLGSGLIAGPAELWSVYSNFVHICLDTGFLALEDLANQAAINLFTWSYDSLTSVLEDGWCQPITEELEWDNGFYRNGNKVKVIHIPTDMQYSADSASYHFRNRFPNPHDEWLAYYKGCSFKPKRIMKPSLGKLKKVT